MKKAPFIILLLLVVAHSAIGQTPRTISYQGRVNKTAGDSVQDGFHLAYFALYDSPTTTHSLFLETQRVAVVHGIFTAIIGSVRGIPDSLTFDKPYWLAVAFEDHTELAPRMPLTSVPYALSSFMAATLSPNADIPADFVPTLIASVDPAAGDLRNSYPDPVVIALQNNPVSSTPPKKGDVLWWSGSWNPVTVINNSRFNIKGSGLSKVDTVANYFPVSLTNDSSDGAFDLNHDFDLDHMAFHVPVDGYYHFEALFACTLSYDQSQNYSSFGYGSVCLLVDSKIYDPEFVYPTAPPYDPNSYSRQGVTINTVLHYATTLRLGAGQIVRLGFNGADRNPTSEFSGFKIN